MMTEQQPTLLASRDEILVAAAATIKRGNIALQWMNGTISTEQARIKSKCTRQALHQRAGRLMERADLITKNLQRFAAKREATNEQ